MRNQSKISILHDLLLIIIPIFVKSYQFFSCYNKFIITFAISQEYLYIAYMYKNRQCKLVIYKLNKKSVSMKRLTFLLFCLLLGIGMANAQTTKVTGTVISAEDNEPIIGASIVVKGTTIGTVTDFNGAFSLDVPSSAKTLVVSFVGMKSQEIGIKPTLHVVLAADNQMLDEVMVVAYGTAKKSSFTGAA